MAQAEAGPEARSPATSQPRLSSKSVSVSQKDGWAAAERRDSGGSRLRGWTRGVYAPGRFPGLGAPRGPGPRESEESARACLRDPGHTVTGRGRRQRRPWPEPLRRALPHSPSPRGPRREPRETQAHAEAQLSARRRLAQAEVCRWLCPRATALGRAGGPRSVAPTRPFCARSLGTGLRHPLGPAVGPFPPSLPAPVR